MSKTNMHDKQIGKIDRTTYVVQFHSFKGFQISPMQRIQRQKHFHSLQLTGYIGFQIGAMLRFQRHKSTYVLHSSYPVPHGYIGFQIGAMLRFHRHNSTYFPYSSYPVSHGFIGFQMEAVLRLYSSYIFIKKIWETFLLKRRPKGDLFWEKVC